MVARGVNVKLKLKNFQVLLVKAFRQPLQSRLEFMWQMVLQLLNEMHIQTNLQFRLVSVGMYQLQQPSRNPKRLVMAFLLKSMVYV